METQRLILASASPQRKELLHALGWSFDMLPSTVHEEAHPELNPPLRAQALATEKARDIAHKNPDAFVIGCDTLVVSADGSLLEKPVDENDARTMLKKLSGNICVVHSGLCIISPDGKEFVDISSSTVHFKKLSERDINWWMQTGLWKDRSGSFQIDGPGQLMIERIEGDFTSIVGLPVYLLGRLLEQAGFRIL